MSISDVASRTGLQSSALRYYESAGLIRSHSRVGGRRHFEPDVLRKLAVIALLQEVGFTINEIKKLLASRGGRDRWRSLAEDKLSQIDEHLDKVRGGRELLTAALACECAGFDHCDLIHMRQGAHRKTVQRMTLQMSK